MVACLGLGNMGNALAKRLLARGHEVCGFDISAGARDRFARAGGRAATSASAAAADADAVVLCLPNAAAVEEVVLEVLASAEPIPPLWIDCTSSLPALTRSLGTRLSERDAVLVDAPVTGGVAGAREGALTAMVGGESADRERARPLLECFAAQVLPAGSLGSGHAIKAINNALSSAALIATAEITAAAQALGQPLEATLDRINRSLARSQNSEVKYTREILTGHYASGFTISLMGKDVATACALSDDVPLPLTTLLHALWRSAEAELGPTQDFTRVHELAVRWAGKGTPPPAEDLQARLCDALAAVLAVAAREALTLLDAAGLDRHEALPIVNAGSGRSEFTRLAESSDEAAGLTIATAIDALDELLSAADVAAPASRVAAELLRGAARELGPDNDLAALVTP
jgi:3-hydroxyisobutyrate dehydrogenase